MTRSGVGALARRYVASTSAPEPMSAPMQTAPAGLVPTQRGTEPDDVATLWASFKDHGSTWAREQLILRYVPLVHAVANRLGMRLPSTVEHADLVSYGMFGLLDAIEKYETDRAVRFESYASSRIRGAILDELRAMDWVPRSVRSRSRSVDQARADLENELHRAPTQAELAARAGMSIDELAATLAQAVAGSVTALDEALVTTDHTGEPLRDRLADETAIDPLAQVEALETSHLLSRAIEELGDRERLVVVLYYYQHRTLAEIGHVLGVTESRVSQMHTAAVGRLRSTMTAAEVA